MLPNLQNPIQPDYEVPDLVFGIFQPEKKEGNPSFWKGAVSAQAATSSPVARKAIVCSISVSDFDKSRLDPGKNIQMLNRLIIVRSEKALSNRFCCFVTKAPTSEPAWNR
ncbi:MAG: hypothetical protein IPJ82_02495 [Lewinellaceae bacterium]|nr:hypothetical protein [Lewinellaceae bacterium]